MLEKDAFTLTTALEAELRRKLAAMPELTAFLPVVRRLAEGDELWLFAVFREQPLEPSLEGRIITVLESTMGMSILRCRVYRLSALPVTRSGRTMRLQVESFVNHLAVPNRLQMRNPEVLEEIAYVTRFAGEGSADDHALL